MTAERVIVVGCIDCRLPSTTNDFIKSLGYEYFPVPRAGGVQDLVRPPYIGFKDSIFRDISIGLLHGAKKIFLVNHEDCHAYRFEFKSRAEEIWQHLKDLKEAKEIISDNLKSPEIIIELFFAELISREREEFSIQLASSF